MVLKDDSPMPFGKYKGTLMANVDTGYLLWLWNQSAGKKPFGEDAQAVQRYILDNLDALIKEVDKPDPLTYD